MLPIKPMCFGALALALLACQRSSSDGSSAPPDTAEPLPAGVASVTGGSVSAGILTAAQNKDLIRQSPDDVLVAPPKVVRLVDGFSIIARNAPYGGPLSTVSSAAVSEIARDARGDYVLVTFSDAEDRSKQMAGWVSMNAITNTSWALQNTKALPAATGAMSAPCATGETRERTDHDFCAKACANDDECERPSGEVCDGLAYAVHAPGEPLTNARYCVSFARPPR